MQKGSPPLTDVPVPPSADVQRTHMQSRMNIPARDVAATDPCSSAVTSESVLVFQLFSPSFCVCSCAPFNASWMDGSVTSDHSQGGRGLGFVCSAIGSDPEPSSPRTFFPFCICLQATKAWSQDPPRSSNGGKSPLGLSLVFSYAKLPRFGPSLIISLCSAEVPPHGVFASSCAVMLLSSGARQVR